MEASPTNKSSGASRRPRRSAARSAPSCEGPEVVHGASHATGRSRRTLRSAVRGAHPPARTGDRGEPTREAHLPEVPGGRRAPALVRRVAVPPLRPRVRRRRLPSRRHDVLQAGDRGAREGARGAQGLQGDEAREGTQGEGGGGLTVYKCAKCLEPIRTNINTVGIQCERCGSKIFYKERP